MKVKELIKELKKMPPEARVFHIWDGAPRTAISCFPATIEELEVR